MYSQDEHFLYQFPVLSLRTRCALPPDCLPYLTHLETELKRRVLSLGALRRLNSGNTFDMIDLLLCVRLSTVSSDKKRETKV